MSVSMCPGPLELYRQQTKREKLTGDSRTEITGEASVGDNPVEPIVAEDGL